MLYSSRVDLFAAHSYSCRRSRDLKREKSLNLKWHRVLVIEAVPIFNDHQDAKTDLLIS